MISRLPRRLRRFFSDCDFDSLSWRADRDLIIGRILWAGDLDSTRWLVRRSGKQELANWLRQRQGAELSSATALGELMLDLPHREINKWIASPEHGVESAVPGRV